MIRQDIRQETQRVTPPETPHVIQHMIQLWIPLLTQQEIQLAIPQLIQQESQLMIQQETQRAIPLKIKLESRQEIQRAIPTIDPTRDPTRDPTIDPTRDPTIDPTIDPTNDPTRDPTRDPTHDPTRNPTSWCTPVVEIHIEDDCEDNLNLFVTEVLFAPIHKWAEDHLPQWDVLTDCPEAGGIVETLFDHAVDECEACEEELEDGSAQAIAAPKVVDDNHFNAPVSSTPVQANKPLHWYQQEPIALCLLLYSVSVTVALLCYVPIRSKKRTAKPVALVESIEKDDELDDATDDEDENNAML
eukprot:192902_1